MWGETHPAGLYADKPLIGRMFQKVPPLPLPQQKLLYEPWMKLSAFPLLFPPSWPFLPCVHTSNTVSELLVCGFPCMHATTHGMLHVSSNTISSQSNSSAHYTWVYMYMCICSLNGPGITVACCTHELFMKAWLNFCQRGR